MVTQFCMYACVKIEQPICNTHDENYMTIAQLSCMMITYIYASLRQRQAFAQKLL